MFGLSGTELAIVLVLALLLLGPSKLPELARSVGKAVRDFKRATGDIRNTVESEFYRMDQDPLAEQPKPAIPTPSKAQGTVSAGGAELPPAGKLPDPYAQAEAEKAAAATPEAKAQALEKDLAQPATPAGPDPVAKPAPIETKS
ncbi:MAG: twin-arginine translocase TatA/TatE family subunit [Myxococcales bacterium]